MKFIAILLSLTKSTTENVTEIVSIEGDLTTDAVEQLEFCVSHPEKYYLTYLLKLFVQYQAKDDVEQSASRVINILSELYQRLVSSENQNRDLLKDKMGLLTYLCTTDDFDPEKLEQYQQKVKLVLIEFAAKRQLDLFKRIYGNLPVELSKKLALELTPDYNENSPTEDEKSSGPSSMTYGEIEFNSFLYIMEWCRREIKRTQLLPSSKLVFTDLGHGTGKAMVAIASVFHELISTVYGIDLSYGLYAESVKRIALYQRVIAEANSSPTDNNFDSHLFHSSDLNLIPLYGDFLQQDYLTEGNPFEFDWTTSGNFFS
jgi:hypothetical protein